MQFNQKRWNKIFSKYLKSEEGKIRIAIIGGGIYGCHIANEIAMFGDTDVVLYEKEKELFAGASSWGDTRIHNGVKYLRNKKTRDLLISEQIRFIKKYSHLLVPFQDHEQEIQMISEDSRSILDFGAFIDLYDKVECGKLILFSDSPYTKGTFSAILNNKHNWSKVMSKDEIMKNFKFQNIEGGILHGIDVCPKMYVDFPRDWFYSEFSKKNNIFLKLEKEVVLDEDNNKENERASLLNILRNKNGSRFNFKIDNEYFDYIINCTYNQSFSITSLENFKQDESPFYEVGFSLVFAERNREENTKNFRAFSVYDGPFPGMTPFNIKNIEESIFSDFKDCKLYTATSGRLGESYKIYDINDAYKIKNEGNNKSHKRFINKEFYSLDDLEEKDVKAVLKAIIHYYPSLMNDFEVIYKYWWIKSLYPSASVSRPIIVSSNQSIHPNFLSIFSNKLSTVIKAEELLLEKIIALEDL